MSKKRYFFSISFFFIFFLVLAGKVEANDYYVSPNGSDSNLGTQDSPWKNLSHACSLVNAPDSLIHVKTGEYVDTSQCNLKIGVSIEGEGSSSWIKSHYANGAYISLSSSGYGTSGNQSISNLKLDGDNLTGSAAISVYHRSNVKIHDLVIVDFNNNAIFFEEASVYWNSAPPSAYAKGNEIYNCTITNCTGTHGGMGMLYIKSQEGILIHDNILDQTDRPLGQNGNIMVGTHNKGMKYYNNKSYKPDNDGENWNFHIEHGNSEGGIEVYNNEFYDGDCPIDIAGIYTYSNVKGSYDYSWYVHHNLITGNPVQTYHGKVAVNLEGPYLEHIWIYYNHFLNWASGAVQIIGWGPDSSLTKQVYIRYNIFDNIGANYWSQAINISSYKGNPAIIDNVFIDNNVFTIKTGVSTRPIYVWQNTNTGSTVSNIYLRNNIIKGTNLNPFLVANNDGTISGLYIYNNILYNNTNNNNPSLGSNVTNYEFSNNLKTDPLFVDVDNGNFNLKPNSPAINAGVDIGQSRDYVNNPIIGLPDIGAYEYTSSQPSPSPSPQPCPADLNGDKQVNYIDLVQVLGLWGQNISNTEDLKPDIKINALDLAVVIKNWGECE